jgi:hypothetical protein
MYAKIANAAWKARGLIVGGAKFGWRWGGVLLTALWELLPSASVPAAGEVAAVGAGTAGRGFLANALTTIGLASAYSWVVGAWTNTTTFISTLFGWGPEIAEPGAIATWAPGSWFNFPLGSLYWHAINILILYSVYRYVSQKLGKKRKK